VIDSRAFDHSADNHCMAQKAGSSSIPVFRVSAGTAFKAGFFGAVGFLVAQVIAGAIVLILIVVTGITFSGLTSSGRFKASSPPAAATEKTSIQRSPAQPQ